VKLSPWLPVVAWVLAAEDGVLMWLSCTGIRLGRLASISLLILVAPIPVPPADCGQRFCLMSSQARGAEVGLVTVNYTVHLSSYRDAIFLEYGEQHVPGARREPKQPAAASCWLLLLVADRGSGMSFRPLPDTTSEGRGRAGRDAGAMEGCGGRPTRAEWKRHPS
jgi:hypothetical protein